MMDEADNLAIYRTELDDVLAQTFRYDATKPGIATANTGAIFKQMEWEKKQYILEVNADVGLFEIIGENATVPLDKPKVRNKMTVTLQDFGKGIDISKDAFDDIQHGVWATDVAKLALKARVTQDAYAFSKFNGAFTTVLSADGSAAIGSHTLIGGGTYTNQLLTADVTGGTTTALNNSSFNAMMIKMRLMVDQRGVPLGDTLDYLLVPPALFQEAIQITESALIADSAQNNINVWRSAYGVEVYSTPYLSTAASQFITGSDSAWFGMSANHCVTRIKRQGLETFLRPWGYSNTRTYNYQANFREETFIPDYSGLIGALGTSA